MYIGSNVCIADVVHNVVHNGYKISIYFEPTRLCLKNKTSAMINSVFVDEAFLEFELKGLISRYNAITYVVSHLTFQFSLMGKGD